MRLSQQSGVDRGSISRYISGVRFPCPEYASKIAKALGVPWSEFRRQIVMRERPSHLSNLIVFGEVRETKSKRDFHQRQTQSIAQHKAAKDAAKAYGGRCDFSLVPTISGDRAVMVGYEDDRELLRRIYEMDALAA
jgi:transcriptional regulator with XRE-family HTH domain